MAGKRFRAKGGGRLLAHAKSRYEKLTLDVYAENTRAVVFYKHAGFHTLTERADPDTGCKEYTML